jgi:glutathione S-transferase
MLEFYTANSSNGQRAAIMLEECGLPYRLHGIDLARGEQREPWFLAINPAGAIPALVDPGSDDATTVRIAQSGAILLYLAMKTGRFFPLPPAQRADAFHWLMLACTDTAAASMTMFLLANYAPERSLANEAFFGERVLSLLRVADARLADREYLAGDDVSIADFALYPLTAVRRALIDAAGGLPHLARWGAALAARPGVQRGMQAAA